MLLFALMAVLLLVITGLAIDAGVSYFSSDQVERAAAAGALAGVVYLPGDLPDATQTALIEVARNGFPNKGSGSCPDNSSAPSPCVVVTQTTTNELTVTVQVTVPTTFLQLLGFGPHVVQRSATAEYLPPIALGQPGAQQGSDISELGTGNNYYFERDEGWGVPRSEGDAFDPSPNQSGSSVVSSPDIHLISPAANGETEANNINYTSGPNYLIVVPVNQKVDLQIFDPSFAPDSCGNSVKTTYCYHEDDGTFSPGSTSGSTDADAFTAMEYSVYKVSTLAQPGSGSLISQEIFDPIDDTGSLGCSGFCYFKSSGAEVAFGCTPNVYHAWISALDYPADACDSKIFKNPVSLGSNELTDPSATTPAYYRLEVDSLQYSEQPICTDSASCATAESPTTADSAYPESHKGYAVRLTAPGTNTVCATGVSQCSTSALSALDDMTVFTPIINPSATNPLTFGIPLFQLDPSYAGTTIDVDVFDPGDVSPGPAYLAIEQPDGTLAAGTVTDLGNSVGSGGGTGVSGLSSWAGTGQSCSACFESANSGGVIYNGQWLQLEIAVPASLNTLSTSPTCSGLTQAACWAKYWTLQYDVAGGVDGDDTFSVQVGYKGTPDRLLP
jgi:hypothetical protein